jgi:hypothetical protein
MTKFAAFWGAVMNFSFVATGVSSANPPMMVLQVAMIFAGAGVAYYAADRFLLPYLAQTLHITTSRRTAPVTVGIPTAGQVA